MLKRKLERKAAESDQLAPKVSMVPGIIISELFGKPFWLRFYEIECNLNGELDSFEKPPEITHIYNPIVYAETLHSAYLRRYLNEPKKVIFIGMNPGPNGMCQTGVAFGNVKTVRDKMQIFGDVLQPPLLHSKRIIQGLDCKREEPSGVRLWDLFERLADGSLDIFSKQCFVHNFCPLAFFNEAGVNITPSELKGSYKAQIRDACLRALDMQLELIKPQIIIAVGDYVHGTLKKSTYCKKGVSVLRMAHPSPRSRNNNCWPEKAQAFLQENDIIKFMRNQA
ncbi:CG5285 [Drosophila busckii]|uniref:CG5285 n=1 Tax=Drosophila busckii TaxID=30019 RepID=A0A0M4EI53_DROBS|nr:single-strand selective monofunctional uracil-DNA glycosylase [Drosophila busckii]ALC46271.1 CG5285 [Drosophila busckii]